MAEMAYLKRLGTAIGVALKNGADRWEIVTAKMASGAYGSEDLAADVGRNVTTGISIWAALLGVDRSEPLVASPSTVARASDITGGNSADFEFVLGSPLDPTEALDASEPVLISGTQTTGVTLAIAVRRVQLPVPAGAPALESQEVVSVSVTAKGGQPVPGVYLSHIFRGGKTLCATATIRLT